MKEETNEIIGMLVASAIPILMLLVLMSISAKPSAEEPKCKGLRDKMPVTAFIGKSPMPTKTEIK